MPASAWLAAVSIASLNLCTDEYLLLLAKPQEIASVSFLARDPQESPLWRTARKHHANQGSLEHVLRQRPDAVLTMGGGGRATSLIAGRLGIRAIDLRPVSSVGDVAFNIRATAAVLGRPEAARPWLRRLAYLQASVPRRPLDAIWLGSGGQTMATPSVGADWMRLAGLRHRSLRGSRVSLETILTKPPAVLVHSEYRSGQMSRGSEWLRHPIIRNARSRRLATDGRAWTCMGPLMIAEVEQLRKALH